MSWQEAKQKAQDWIGSLKLGKNLRGEVYNLDTMIKFLEIANPVFELMVKRAAAQILRKRGASVFLTDDGV